MSLSIAVTLPDGRVVRWGPDEPNAQDLPDDLTFSSSVPGGHKDLTTNLLRRIDLDYSDQALFATIQVLGEGNTIVWEGRLHAFPRSHGASTTITPQAVGWAAHLRDDPSFRQVYVDRDPGSWGDMPFNERVRLAANGVDFGSLSWANTGGRLVLAFPNQALGAEVIATTWYTAPVGVTIAKAMYNVAETTFPYAGPAFMNWTTVDELGAEVTATLTVDGTTRTATPSEARRYVSTGPYSAGSAVTPDPGSNRRFNQIAVYGDHGLTTRTITGDPDGVYASDVVAHIVSTTAPLLTYTTGDGGSIEPTTFAIPHLVFREPGTAEDAILQTNKFHQYEWGVWDNREFFFRQPNPDRLCWEARLADGAQLDLEGDQADDAINGVLVSYTDAGNGERRLAGPAGSGLDVEDDALGDASDTNPVNAAGIPVKWATISVSDVTTDAGAVAIGAAYLREKQQPQRRGSLTLTGTVTHPTKGQRPVYEVRAGDYVRISDHPADVPRRILEARHTPASRSVTLTLDNTSTRTEALLERMGVVLVGRI